MDNWVISICNWFDKELNNIEESKLKETGKTREHYEKLVEDLTKNVSKQEN